MMKSHTPYKYKRIGLFLLTLLLGSALVTAVITLPAQAQFDTPLIDGTISAGEYGDHTDGQNQQTSGSQVWYMTWDDTHLYLGTDVANVAEGAVLYVDVDPLDPINGGTHADGNLTGQDYDGASFASLPLRADFVAYYKNGYQEYRTADGSGGWSGATTGFGTYADDGGDTREIAIPWSAITGGGRPATFAFFAYAVSGGGFVYGQVPAENAGGAIGTTARYAHSYGITSTVDTASTPPFSKPGSTVFINEADADTPSTDAEEFIELYDGGVGNTPLDGLVVAAYNGSVNVTYDLTGTSGIDLDGFTTDANGYFLLGNAAVPGVDIIFNGNTLQNGQDAVALYLADGADFPTGTAVTTTHLIDALVYDTNDADDPELLPLLNPGQPQVNEGGGGNSSIHSNQRCPNGAGGLRNTDTYTQQTPTAGSDNNCLPDLNVGKTGPTVASAGQNITYTISYGNNGITDATAVVLTDTLPTGLSYVSDSSGFPCPACTPGATGTITWTAGTVTVGGGSSFELVASIPATIPVGSPLTNTVSLASPDGDGNPADNGDEWVTTINPLDLIVGKTGPAIGFSDETLVYNLSLQNSGVATATNVVLTDTLPLSVTYAADDAPWPAVVAGNVVTWAVGDLAPNSFITFNLTATAASGVANGTILSNLFTAVTATAGDDPANNSDSWDTTIYTLVPIATARAGSDGQVFGVEGRVIYTPGTYNSSGWGLQDASGGIAVFYNPPPAVSLGDTVRLVATRGTFNNEEQFSTPVLYFQNLGAGPEVAPAPFNTGDVPSGSSEGWLAVITGTVANLTCPTDFNYDFTLDDGSGEGLVFVDGDTGVDVCGAGLENGMEATVMGFSTQFGTDFEVKPRRPADVSFTLSQPAIGKTAPAQVAPNELFTYTVTVENQLGYALTNVVITDVVPALSTFAYALDGGVYGNGTVTWTLASLADGSGADVRFAVTAPPLPGLVENEQYAVLADNYLTPTYGTPVSTLVISGALSIHDIQGARHFSLFNNQPVTDIEGIVTAMAFSGFYMQEPNPDGDEATSEGIFVFTGALPTVAVGDHVRVDGTVTEFYPGGSSTGNLSITEISSPSITVLSSGNPLPPPTIIGNGGRIPPNQIIDNDSNGSVNTTPNFDPDEDGIDFYESMEGIRVQVNNAVVVGSNNFGEIAVVADNGVNGGLFNPRGGIVIQPDDYNPERIIIDDALVSAEPDTFVGDSFSGSIVGVLDYSFGNFKLLNPAPLPAVTPGGLQPETTGLSSSADQLTVATFNVENLDPSDTATKFAGLAYQIVNNMQAPDIIGLQEIQDNTGPINDGTVSASETYTMLIGAIIDAGGPLYEFRDIAPEDNQDGGQPGANIRVGFLFQPARVTFVDRPGGTAVLATTVSLGSSGVELSYSPGRVSPQDSAFFDSRKPLAGEFIFNENKVIVVVNHFNSKGGDDPLFGRWQPPVLGSEVQRLQQAQVVNDFVDTVLALDADANVIVLGDLNDFQFSLPIDTLKGGVLTNLIDSLPPEERYTYIFDGNSQTLDHILVSDNLAQNTAADVVHVNAEFDNDYRATDHDPVVARFTLPVPVDGTFIYLPFMQKAAPAANQAPAAEARAWFLYSLLLGPGIMGVALSARRKRG